MRVLVISDTHGRHTNLDKVLRLEDEESLDCMIHLGDVEGGEDYLEAIVDCEKHIVRGNNDFFSELPAEDEFYIGNKKVFITHGHQYRVSVNIDDIRQEGLSRQADLVMFGHTHKPYFDQTEDITVLNPGSISYPRQIGRKPSYMIIEINEAGEVSFDQKYLD